MTDYDSLGGLIKRYNAVAKRSFPGHEIQGNLANLRDALAHGRVFLPTTGLPLQLLKFTKPRGGKVSVMFAATLTAQWIAAQNAIVCDAITKTYAVRNAARRPRPSKEVAR